MNNFALKHFIVVPLMGLLSVMLISAAHPKSKYHVKSQDLPATLKATTDNCSEIGKKKRTPGAEYVPGRSASGGAVTPADINPTEPQDFPIVRYDLGLKSRHLQSNGLSVGEVSVDTRTGEVALDGRSLYSGNQLNDCYTNSR